MTPESELRQEYAENIATAVTGLISASLAVYQNHAPVSLIADAQRNLQAALSAALLR